MTFSASVGYTSAYGGVLHYRRRSEADGLKLSLEGQWIAYQRPDL